MNNAVKRTINEDPSDRQCNHCSVDAEPTLLVVRTWASVAGAAPSHVLSASFVPCITYLGMTMTQLYKASRKLCNFCDARKVSEEAWYALIHPIRISR